MSLPRISPYRIIWDSFLKGEFILCLSNDIIHEYMEILSMKTSPAIANHVISTILNARNTRQITPYYHFNLITSDGDDNKFVDCSIAANASYIVTNDHHFDALKTIKFPRVDIIRIGDFCSLIDNNQL
jgi:putative PIN family toxin of toxin-antitoxin system